MPELFDRSLPVTMQAHNPNAPEELFRSPLPIRFADFAGESNLDEALAYFVDNDSQTREALDNRYFSEGGGPEIVEDNADPGFFTMTGFFEDPNDQGTYIDSGSA